MIKPYWHEYNPWKDRVIYVPLQNLIAAGVSPIQLIGYGMTFDPYLLPNPSGDISCGIRYGKKPTEYLSFCLSQKRLKALLNDTNNQDC